MVVPIVELEDPALRHPDVLANVTYAKELQPENACSPMLVTLPGIVMLVRLLQL